jgi:hypothetical protein
MYKFKWWKGQTSITNKDFAEIMEGLAALEVEINAWV